MKDPIQNDKRESKRIQRLQGENTCFICNITDSRVLARLTPERLLALVAKAQNGDAVTLCGNEINALTGRTAIERDHVLGRNVEPKLTLPFCRNDHLVETERRRDAGISMVRPLTVPELLLSALSSLAQLFSTLVQICVRWTEYLMNHIAVLDEHFPDWRKLEMPK
jgi:hypothetical protein